MKKLINAAEDVVSQSLAGFCAAHSDIVRMGDGAPFVQRRDKKPGKVALVSGGGSGHEPLHSGFIGHGMLDAACPGQVFTSPTPDLILAAAEAADNGGGVLLIVKNYEGDVMNFDMAREMAARHGVPGLYHETITWAYLLLVHERMQRDGALCEWESFCEANRDLFAWKPSILERYYRPETLNSELARSVFILPDAGASREMG